MTVHRSHVHDIHDINPKGCKIKKYMHTKICKSSNYMYNRDAQFCIRKWDTVGLVSIA